MSEHSSGSLSDMQTTQINGSYINARSRTWSNNAMSFMSWQAVRNPMNHKHRREKMLISVDVCNLHDSFFACKSDCIFWADSQKENCPLLRIWKDKLSLIKAWKHILHIARWRHPPGLGLGPWVGRRICLALLAWHLHHPKAITCTY